MNIINAHTRISALIRYNPEAIEVIAGINEHFRKLRNPVLRKIFTSRVTIAEAARIGKVDIQTFFDRLRPIGFVVQGGDAPAQDPTPAGVTPVARQYDRLLDVRPCIAAGEDPFKIIMNEVNTLPAGATLLLVNSFEPVPLIRILQGKNFGISVTVIGDDEVHTYITGNEPAPFPAAPTAGRSFEEAEHLFAGRMQESDVRQLPMPLPMQVILEKLETLPEDQALFVYHKKIPVFLLQELQERNYRYACRHAADGVHVIIYKEPSAYASS